ALAEPEGYVRLFLDAGEPMAALLRRFAANAARKGEHAAPFVARLLAAFAVPGATELSAEPGHAEREARLGQPPTLIEPISEREREVLRLMAEGLTNEQIARGLIIAVGTVKAHIHNISGKLGAQNRAHAVARATELGLLSRPPNPQPL
ncbi:MAG: hypothetical protein IT317_10610, partial [Anaerolineales bacterium]|nr:hypothetical protein [Anaerolineales bacterium]